MKPAVIDLTERRRAATLADLVARISQSTPPREDIRRYPGGHVWRRHVEHERTVLRVVARRQDGVRA